MARRKNGKSDASAILPQLNLNAAGIDIGSSEHFVAVPAGRDEVVVKSFGSFTCDLYEIAKWLRKCDIETVAMESTGVYWITLFQVLEAEGFDVKLVDPHHLKNVPGRKTDVVDCQWIQQLHSYGLLSSAFIPDSEVWTLRAYVRQRAMLVENASAHIQHMQKALTQMNIKLQNVVSDITGKTGMRIIWAIIEGERDPLKLAILRDRRCKNSKETIAKALEGHWRDEHLFALKQAVELFEFYQAQIRSCDIEIEKVLKGFADKSDGQPMPPQKASTKKRRKNAPHFDLRSHLCRMTGVDLTRIDGLEAATILKVLSETGYNMSRWPTHKHFASWLGLSPNNRISGGKILSRRTRPTTNKAAGALRLSAQSLHHSHSALGAFLRRQKARKGMPKAITATAHKLAIILYTMLRDGTAYTDLGENYYEKLYKKRVVDNLHRRARQFGYSLSKIEPSLSAVN